MVLARIDYNSNFSAFFVGLLQQVVTLILLHMKWLLLIISLLKLFFLILLCCMLSVYKLKIYEYKILKLQCSCYQTAFRLGNRNTANETDHIHLAFLMFWSGTKKIERYVLDFKSWKFSHCSTLSSASSYLFFIFFSILSI